MFRQVCRRVSERVGGGEWVGSRVDDAVGRGARRECVDRTAGLRIGVGVGSAAGSERRRSNAHQLRR